MKISILGAAGTGKTRLACELAGHLQAQADTVSLIPDSLRAWCARAGRTPRAAELSSLMQEQNRRVDAVSSAQVLIADSTPLLTAISSDLLLGDRSLYDSALEHQRRYDLTLLTGLDLAWGNDGLPREALRAREAADALLRAALGRAGIAFTVVYGSGPERSANALKRIAPRHGIGGRSSAWTWSCDKCSDPACEHRLFTGLRGLKAADPPPP